MKNLKSFLKIMFVMSLLVIAGCEYPIEPTVSEPPEGGLDFIIQTEGGEPLSVNSVDLHQLIWFRARTNDTSIQVFTWNFGNGDTARGKEQLYGFNQLGAHTVCVTGWRRDGTHIVFCALIEVVISGTGINPVVKQKSSMVLSGGRYRFELQFRQESITLYTNCGTGAPFATYNTIPNGSWIIHQLNPTLTGGYYTDTITVKNFDTLKFAFGGSANCYANMAPTADPPQTSRFWHDDSNPSKRGLWAINFNGNLVSVDTVINLPPSVGDNMVRVSMSPTSSDTVLINFNMAYVIGNTGSTAQWANNITGLSVGKTITDTPGFTGWKQARLHKNQLINLLNQLIQFKYGRPLSNLAPLDQCIFFNPNSGLLEFVFFEIGGRMHIRYYDQIAGSPKEEALQNKI